MTYSKTFDNTSQYYTWGDYGTPYNPPILSVFFWVKLHSSTTNLCFAALSDGQNANIGDGAEFFIDSTLHPGMGMRDAGSTNPGIGTGQATIVITADTWTPVICEYTQNANPCFQYWIGGTGPNQYTNSIIGTYTGIKRLIIGGIRGDPDTPTVFTNGGSISLAHFGVYKGAIGSTDRTNLLSNDYSPLKVGGTNWLFIPINLTNGDESMLPSGTIGKAADIRASVAASAAADDPLGNLGGGILLPGGGDTLMGGICL